MQTLLLNHTLVLHTPQKYLFVYQGYFVFTQKIFAFQKCKYNYNEGKTKRQYISELKGAKPTPINTAECLLVILLCRFIP